jgi:ferritin-like metal-binding protein YciE
VALTLYSNAAKFKTKHMVSNIAKENFDEARELRGLFEKQLKELYWAESIMIFMLEDISAVAESADLVNLLASHRLETTNHVARLEQLFKVMGIEADALKHDGLQCLIDEAENLEGQTRKGVVRDAAIIAVLQKIKHFEIACYGTMRAFAIALREEHKNVIAILEESLQEEKNADQALSYIAVSHINVEAADKEI